jgi:hypothetical protein
MSPLARQLFVPENPTAAGTMMVVVGSGSTPVKPQFEMWITVCVIWMDFDPRPSIRCDFQADETG